MSFEALFRSLSSPFTSVVTSLRTRLPGAASVNQNKPVDSTSQFLSNSTIFAEVSPAALEFLNSRVVSRRYFRHEMIFRDDNPGVCMFMVEQGQVEIFIENDNGDHVTLALRESGSLFGEIAASFGNNRTASARAHCNDTLLLTVSRFDLNDLNKRFPQDGLRIQTGISRSVVNSLIETTNQVRELQRQITDLQQQSGRHERR